MLICEITLPKRSKYGIGKPMVNNIYVHKQYADLVIPEDILQHGVCVVGDFPYIILKYNIKTDVISFIESLDFNTNPEPVVGRSLLVKPDSDQAKVINPPSDPWIYHHKWMMVKDDYKGFDVKEAKQRSLQWLAYSPDSSRIGKKSYWDNEVLPKLS